MSTLRDQLEMFGLEGARLRAQAAGASPRERTRLVRRVEKAHEIMAALPASDELSFLHSGLCQTCLPHSKQRTAAHLGNAAQAALVSPSCQGDSIADAGLNTSGSHTARRLA